MFTHYRPCTNQRFSLFKPVQMFQFRCSLTFTPGGGFQGSLILLAILPVIIFGILSAIIFLLLNVLLLIFSTCFPVIFAGMAWFNVVIGCGICAIYVLVASPCNMLVT